MEKENFNNAIGKKVKELRLKQNWTQRDVAVRLGISIPAFSKIETGITDINTARLKQIANLFEVPVAELSFGVKEKGLDTKTQLTIITNLKATIAQREQDIIKIQRKLIDLYEELENLNRERLG